MMTKRPIFKRKFIWTALFTLCFAAMVGLSPFLHSHEFDLKDLHQDCSPCHFSHSNAGLIPILEPLTTDFDAVSQIAFYQETHTEPVSIRHSGRSPPLFS
ncbi:conserved exported hypothetical protein, putative Cytochrome c [Nitrospina gracilis 3/211]|uniref:Uncharacterized protein n=1 Tax=Nitrospina gracilis (strain 3/211) TaxID=1266370 RepID=M1Z0L7_NITG3|nr:hypothetical protein [Nitrospina sp. Nb-3]MCF8724113.1 hypothetical protein [Nitrospina sp. Nb-3]CCQ91255.1 conserved exported hypothetical protein, putative Cytochrome c [Nitrospina gracilis 3/211]